MSIRWRLTLWNTLALAALLVAFAVLVYVLLARALYQRIDQSLFAELQELLHDPRMAEDSKGRLRHWIYEFQEHENIFCVVYDSEGNVYEKTMELAAVGVPPLPPDRSTGFRFHDATLPIVGRQRVLESRIQPGDREFTVLLLAPLEGVDHELGRLLRILFMAVPVALALSGGMAYLLARKALGPMERLSRLTGEITADSLHHRLPVANPRDELGRLAQTINAMIGRLENSFAEIRRFTADASHELRTPLTAIRTEAEVALARPLSIPDCQNLLGSILEECDRLARLTDQLLALAREDAGVVDQVRESVDLAALVGGVVETMRPLAEAKGLRLLEKVNEQVRVRGDEVRLREVFFNLVDNAIKYTAEGGAVEVQVGHQDLEAFVRVRDSGIGIPPEHLPRVFDRFYRVDKARSRTDGGTGLGLSIAQSIVIAHGGQIDLASTPGQNTICTVTLPQDPSARD